MSRACELTVALVLLAACAGRPRPEPQETVPAYGQIRRVIQVYEQSRSRLPAEGCNEKGICLAYWVQGECPNWGPALVLAKKKAGCGDLGADDANARECRKKFACDICQLLENEAWPRAIIKVYPGGEPLLLGHAEGATVPKAAYTPGSFQVVWIEIRQARCYGPGVGVWPFGEDNVEFLAKAIMHESLHVCKYIGGYGPSTVHPGAQRIVDSCF